MAYSPKCVACGNTTFELKEVSPSGSRYKLLFVQCTSCGVPVGVLDYFNIGAKIEGLEAKIEEISLRLSRVDATSQNIDNNLARLANMIKR